MSETLLAKSERTFELHGTYFSWMTFVSKTGHMYSSSCDLRTRWEYGVGGRAVAGNGLVGVACEGSEGSVTQGCSCEPWSLVSWGEELAMINNSVMVVNLLGSSSSRSAHGLW